MRSSIPTVEEFLALADVAPGLTFDKFEEGKYHCVHFYLVESKLLFRRIEIPQVPFRVLVTDLTRNEGIAHTPGWKPLMGLAISEVGTTLSPGYDTVGSIMLIDKPIGLSKVSKLAKEFEFYLHYYRDDPFPTVRQLAELVDAFCYVSLNTFMAREKDLFDRFLTRELLQEMETLHRQATTESRAQLWSDIGPECGPEVCVEPGCDRLRIRLAVRCFVHQVLIG